MPISEIFLSIKESGKGIPFRDDGTQNHGFMAVKGKPAEAALIPEVQDNDR